LEGGETGEEAEETTRRRRQYEEVTPKCR